MATELLAQPADILAAWPAYGALPALQQASLLASASQKILNTTRAWGFFNKTVTQSLNGNGLSRLWLAFKPIITISTVTMDGVLLDNTSGYAYSFTPRTGELIRGTGRQDLRFAYRWPHGRQNIVVQYWAGYYAVPDPVVMATVWTVRWLYDQTQQSGIYSSERIGDYSYTLNAAALSLTLPTHIMALLVDYVVDDGPV